MPEKTPIFPAKGTQTEVKHSILSACLRAWGGIIVNSNRGRRVALSYVDTCCGSGLYARDPEDTGNGRTFEVGSAIIGLTELASLLDYGQGKVQSISAKALFINESATELATLKQAIADKVPNAPPYTPIPGLFTDHVDDVVAACDRSFSFVFIDPYGPMAVPFDAVSRVVKGRYTDTIIHFPYYAVEKWTGWLEKGQQAQRLAHVDALMNGAGWRDVVLDARRNGIPLEPRLLAYYIAQLAALGVYTCSIPMLFPDRQRVLYHLVFTSRNVAGFASAKAKFQKADQYQAYLRHQLKVGPKQGFLFNAEELAPADPVKVDDLATTIRARFPKGTSSFEQVVGVTLMQEHVLQSHVEKALRRLRTEKAVTFKDLSWKAPITFL